MRLSNLEGAALATIAGRGSATAYAIAKSLSDPPSEFWSGSAGAVYPLIRRLARTRASGSLVRRHRQTPTA
jgi:DNA-binding PadR family transcriptional regulator